MKPERQFQALCLAVFLGFLCIGIPLPILPAYIHSTLGMSMLVAGLGVGLQSVVTLFTRSFACHYADTVGSRAASRRGFLCCTIAAIFYLLSSYLSAVPTAALVVLFAGRMCLGIGESFMLTGVLAWGIEILGTRSSGKVISWNGIAMYEAIAVGAPIGLWTFASFSFLGVASLVLILPVLGFLIVTAYPAAEIAPTVRAAPSFLFTLRRIWIYGTGVALGGVGFGALSAFVAVLFQERGWPNSGYALLIFGSFYIGVRLVLGNLPDTTGGRSAAIASLCIEFAGQLILWQADSVTVAYIGVALTGAGYSLLFPSYGVQALKRVPPESKGTALGAFSAFFDITLGITAPLCGLIIEYFGVRHIYLFGAVAALASLMIASTQLTKATKISNVIPG